MHLELLCNRWGSFMSASNDLSMLQVSHLAKHAVGGNIRKILDSFDGTGDCIAEFITLLENIVPRIQNKDNLIYAPAIEWFMDSVTVHPNMETNHKGWFAVGDGAGLSQGIVHAAATGIIAARDICSRLESTIVTT